MSRIIALDTETTGLDPNTEDVFEIAAIDLDTDEEYVWRIEPRPAVVERMHPKAAEVNRYHERTSAPDWRWDDRRQAMSELHDFIDGAHLLGAVPDFDARHLTSLFRRMWLSPPQWHYHLIDVEALAVGYLAAKGQAFSLPWKSDDLSRAVGVEPPSGDDRHTALADARWAVALWRAIVPEVSANTDRSE